MRCFFNVCLARSAAFTRWLWGSTNCHLHCFVFWKAFSGRAAWLSVTFNFGLCPCASILSNMFFELSPQLSHLLGHLLLLLLQLDQTSNTSRQKNNLPANQKGYNTFETTVEKLSTRRIQICQVYFCKIYFWPPFKIMSKQKYTRQIWVRLVEYSSFKVSDPSQVPLIDGKLYFSHLRKSSWFACTRKYRVRVYQQ